METNDQVEARLEKLTRLREMGINPYPYRFPLTHDSAALTAAREELLASNQIVAFAGRIVRYNIKGKIAFNPERLFKMTRAKAYLFGGVEILGEGAALQELELQLRQRLQRRMPGIGGGNPARTEAGAARPSR